MIPRKLDARPKAALRRSLSGTDPTLSYNLSIDVQRTMSRLSPRTCKMLAVLLPELSVPEICTATSRSRRRIYQLIQDLKAAFLTSGLAPIAQQHCDAPSGGGRE